MKKTESSLVSIIMNCYNSDQFLREAIDSVYEQSYQDWEIVFWDNASTDNSASIAKSYDERVKYYRSSETLSLGEARKMALENANGKYIAFLDCDDLYLPSKLERQVAIMDSHDDVGLVYSNTMYFSEWQDKRKAYNDMMPSGFVFKELLEDYFMSFETVMVRKAVLEERKISFNPNYKISTDAELFIRIAYYTKCFYIDEVLAKWRYGHGSESDRGICLFPKDYEQLLKDLSLMIENFDNEYGSSISILRSKINNRYGCCEWSHGNRQLARNFFLQAIRVNVKYIIPYFFTFIVNYKMYSRIRMKVFYGIDDGNF